MKTLLALVFSLSCFTASPMAEANNKVKEIVEKEEKNQSKKKKKRRKKVQMCKECGKPETQCKCEGEGHGVHEDHDHEGHDHDDHDHDDHDHDDKEKKK